jgi:hypothetical protein
MFAPEFCEGFPEGHYHTITPITNGGDAIASATKTQRQMTFEARNSRGSICNFLRVQFFRSETTILILIDPRRSRGCVFALTVPALVNVSIQTDGSSLSINN